MRSGSLDRRITLQRPVTADDGYGETVTAWVDVLRDVPARREDLSDSQRMAARQVGSAITTRFQVRYGSEIAAMNSAWRLLCEGRAFAIDGVKEIQRRMGLEITATAQSDTPLNLPETAA